MVNKQEDLLLKEKDIRLSPPKSFKVILLNDDYTPMEFVVLVLKKYFMLETEKATQVMLKVHTEGMAVCGIFSKDVAASKVDQVVKFSRKNNHPLQCTMEEN